MSPVFIFREDNTEFLDWEVKGITFHFAERKREKRLQDTAPYLGIWTISILVSYLPCNLAEIKWGPFVAHGWALSLKLFS